MNILISGGSGLLGKKLTQLLQQKAYQVAWLSRSASDKSAVKTFAWDPMNNQIDDSAVNWADVIIHLAGAGVADKPWTKKRKQEILDSRVLSTRLLVNSLQRTNKKLHAFISASAIGYYGFVTTDELLTEESEAGTDFLAEVVKKWENEIFQAAQLNIRAVVIRIGIVLSAAGGALKAMASPVKFGLGAPLGSGKQQMAWIHIDDLCQMFIHAIENARMKGVYNGVGNNAVSNKSFTRAIAKSINRPMILPNVPAFVMKLMLGEMANMVLQGSAVSNKKIVSTGFAYQYQTLEAALDNLLKK